MRDVKNRRKLWNVNVVILIILIITLWVII